MSDGLDRLVTVMEREWRTVLRSRAYLGLVVGFAVVVVALVGFARTGTYVPVAMTLSTPVELIVPALAAAFGYRPILGDRERGELDVLRTYPLSRDEYVWGVYFGRLAALLVAVVVPLLLVGLIVPFLGKSTTFLPRPGGLDSPWFYLRFVVLSGVYAAVMLAVMTALSAIASDRSRALVVAVSTVLVLALGVDFATILGVVASGPSMATLVALSPTGAFRGLVLALVVDPVSTTPLASTTPFLSALVLLCWFAAALVLAVLRVWERTD